jgi:hypothetical protein
MDSDESALIDFDYVEINPPYVIRESSNALVMTCLEQERILGLV